MIRREMSGPTGVPIWLLIDQIEHARLAGDLAAAWNLQALPRPWRDELRWSARHHDDGWLAWDEAPLLDDSGRPISFREMAVDDSNRIWASSIAAARDRSPLSAYLVARHFLDLRGHGTSADDPAAISFRNEFEPLTANWLRDATSGPDLVPETGADAVTWLQMFDWLSLLLCCGPLAEPEPLPVPQRAEPVPQRAEYVLAARDEYQLTLSIWPFGPGELALSCSARQVPARRYHNVAELRSSCQPTTLNWKLTPA